MLIGMKINTVGTRAYKTLVSSKQYQQVIINSLLKISIT